MAEAREHFNRGVQLQSTGSWAGALAAYEAALALNPDLVAAAVGVARVRELCEQWSYASDAWSVVLHRAPDRVDAATSRAEALRQAGCIPMSIDAYDVALDLDPRNLYALAGKGESLRLLGRPEEALDWFSRAIQVQPDHPFAVRGLGAALNALGRFEEALPLWERAEALDPTSTLVAEGLELARTGVDAPMAVPMTSARAPLAQPTESELLHQWGNALVADNRLAEAAVALERALEHSPNATAILRDLGAIYEATARWNDAQEVLRRLLETEARAPDLAVRLGHAARHSRRYVDALGGYDLALSEDPEHLGALTGRAEALRLLGRWEEAAEWFDRVLALRPTQMDALRGKAGTLGDLRRFDEARAVWKLAETIEPDSDVVAAGLALCDAGPVTRQPTTARERATRACESGRALMQQGQSHEAAGMFAEATQADPTWISGWFHLGTALSEDRQFAAAVQAFDEVLSRQATHIDAACHRADALRRDNQHTEAIHGYDAVLREHPDELRAIVGRAEAQRVQGKLEEAIVGFDRALTLRPRHFLVLCAKAASLSTLERYQEALPVWLAALREEPNAPYVKRGLAHCRAHLGDAAQPHPNMEQPRERALPIAAPPTGLSAPRSRLDRQRARDELDRGRYFSKEQRNFSAAIGCFEAALQHDPTFAEAALRLGMAHEEDRHLERAIQAYRRCLAIEPKHFHAATNIGEAYRKNERYTEAIEAYEAALELKADYLYAIAGRAECMRMLGDLKGSLLWFDRALEVGPRHAFAIQGKAAALNTMQQYREAHPLWMKALEIEPNSEFAKEGQAVCERNLHEEPTEDDDPTSPTPTLDYHGRDLSDLARKGALSPVIGRSGEIRAVMKTLVRRLKANPLLLGDPGVGKTAIVEGVAQALVADDAPERLAHLRLVELSMGSLLAGTKYRGTFEERLKDIIKEAREEPGVVLFIDEIHTLVGAGRTEGGSLDAANILKPALARGEISVIGATTVAEYRKHFESDSALDRRFQPIDISEPNEAATIELLGQVAPLYEGHHSVKVVPSALTACVRLGVRFIPDRRLPDKALDLLDEACADASLSSDNGVVDAARVARVVSERTGVRVHDLTANERAQLSDLESVLAARVMGQGEAVSELARSVRLARSGLRDPARPRGVFLFAGASGVGKTELARALSDILFPEGDALIKLDMAEYGDGFSGSRLLGAPPGYQGHGEEGQLTGPLRRRPYAVVLLDEFEKAHSTVQAMFLSLFDEGVVTDADGRKVHAREAFFILTTNAGSDKGSKAPVGFAGDSQADRKAEALARARGLFRPELMNRLDGVVVFRELDDTDIVGIVELHLGHLRTRAAGAGIALSWSPDVPRLCAARYQARDMGARPALRAINDLVAEPLGALILSVGGDRHRALNARVHEGAVVFDEPTPAGGQDPHAATIEAQIS